MYGNDQRCETDASGDLTVTRLGDLERPGRGFRRAGGRFVDAVVQTLARRRRARPATRSRWRRVAARAAGSEGGDAPPGSLRDSAHAISAMHSLGMGRR